MSRETHRNTVEELICLRRANKRVSQYYEDHYEHFIRLAGLNVISSTDEGNGKYSVTDVSGNVTEVTVSGKIPPLAPGEGENLDCKFPYAPW